MKTIVLFSFLMLFLTPVLGQQFERPNTGDPEDLYRYHMTKYGGNISGAIILGGGGLVLLWNGAYKSTLDDLGGVAAIFYSGGEDEIVSDKSYFILGGLFSILISIYCIDMATDHKKKANFYLSQMENKVGNIKIDNSGGIGLSYVITLD